MTAEAPFAALRLPAALVAALAKRGIVTPTPIQQVALPRLFDRADAVLTAETGTGKTLAYLLPLLAAVDHQVAATQVVVVAPTHELAIQIQRVAMQLVQDAGWSLRTLLLVGGTSLDRQLDKLKAKPHVVVGTPGRLIDLLRLRKLKLERLRALVVDEADLLLGSEARPAIEALVRAAPAGRQLLFASATMRPDARAAVAALAPAALDLAVAAAPVNADLVHLWLGCERRDKPDLLRRLWHALQPERTLVFVHQDERAEEIAAKLEYHQVPVADLHGAFRKEERKEAMEEFRAGRARVLIASDLAARGLDLPGVSHVINLDVPTDPQAYLHRTGRTARAGRKGSAITLMTPQEERVIARYEEALKIRLRRVWLREGRVVEEAP